LRQSLIILLLCCFACIALQAETRYFKGRLDDLVDVSAELNFDGKIVSGQWTYLQSNISFKLKGQVTDDILVLDELNERAEVSGTLKGKLLNDRIEASWANIGETISSYVILNETTVSNPTPTLCGDNKWLNIYTTKVSGEKVELILQREANAQLHGICYKNGKDYRVIGEVKDDRVSLILKDYRGRLAGEYTGKLKAGKSLKGDFLHKTTTEDWNFKLQSAIEVGCQSHADYQSTFDITYPLLKNQAFDYWMQNQIKNWVITCEEHIESKGQLQAKSPTSRASAIANAWCSIEYIDSKVVSGRLIFDQSWAGEQASIPFSFDLKKSQAINITDLFNHNFDHAYFVDNYIKNVFKAHKQYDADPKFNDWLEACAFPHFSIRKDGVNFSTDYNRMYGQLNITIPFSELSAYMKVGHPITYLIEE